MTKHDALRKQRIIDYIAATLRARGYPPSVREIAVGGRPRVHVRGPPPPVRAGAATATSSVARPARARCA